MTVEVKQSFNYMPLGIGVLLILHLVGLVGILWINQDFFASLTPLVLVISTFLLFIVQVGHRKPLFKLFIWVTILGYAVELLGTQTGFPFGIYLYGSNLKPHLKGVPLVIGINWFLVTVGAYNLMRLIFSGPFSRILFGALAMTILDFLIEPVAMTLDYWDWQTLYPPLSNYLAWFVVSFLFLLLCDRWFQNAPNALAAYYFMIMGSFFLILNIAL